MDEDLSENREIAIMTKDYFLRKGVRIMAVNMRYPERFYEKGEIIPEDSS